MDLFGDDPAVLTESELVRRITYHNRKYWQDGEPEISDEAYDALVRALAQLNPTNPLLFSVEAPLVEGTGKVTHEKPMLSLDKAYSLDELLDWVKKFARSDAERLLIQPKYDGISALWEHGTLATRGDGFVGEDISGKAPLIELERPGYIGPLSAFPGFARGEIVIRNDDFHRLYATIRNRNGRTYKNARNAVAGIMGLKDISEMLAQHAKLTLADYSLYSWESTSGALHKDWPNLLETIESLPYPMDGVVLKLADETYSDSLGATAHHPRGQIAFKFSGVRKTSKLLAVEWSFGKNCLTPVAEIEPIEISGTTIRHATLHNLQNVLDKDLHLGDSVVVERAGDVIPYIVSSEPGSDRKNCLIEHCPSCGTPLTRDLPELRCLNPDCFETRLQRLLSAVRNIGIERLGEPNIRKMMTTLHVRALSDIFKLTIPDILRLDGFKCQSAENLYREIQEARSVPDYQILASLNIRGIGPNIAKAILANYSLEELEQLGTDALSAIDGIGPERASALAHELVLQRESLQELLSCVEVRRTKGDVSAPGPEICFTGKMPEKRSRYESMALEHGYIPVDSVSSRLAVLVAADQNDASSKLKKARKLGIHIVSLTDWLEEIHGTESKNMAESGSKSEHSSLF